MDVSWQQELIRLLSTDELKIGVVLALLAAAGGRFVGLGKSVIGILSRFPFRATQKNFESASFGEAEVRAALRGYVFHQGMHSDPSTRVDLADALLIRTSNLFSMLDSAILSAESNKYLFIFADCGMGKTTFLINYFHRRGAKLGRSGLSMALVSLSHSGYLDEINNIPIEERPRTVLLMDAFDEDPLVLEGVTKRLNLLVTMTLTFRTVVISCRSQFFASSSEIPTGTGVVKAGPTPAAVSKEHEFSRIYIAPFDDKRVRQYLRKTFGIASWRKQRRAKAMLKRVPSLVMRPMLLAHISDVLEEENRASILTQSDIYQAIVSAWVRRERRWVPDKLLLEFSKRLALDLFQNRHHRGGEHCARSELEQLAKSWDIKIRPEFLAGRSLLNRTDDGRCKFAHRSIMEYLVAASVVEGRTSKGVELTGQIAAFMFDQLAVTSGFPEGWLDQNARVEIVEPDVRLGYPTNYNLYHESADELDPSAVFGILTKDELGASDTLGEFLQSMISQLGGQRSVRDVRISVAECVEGSLVAYASVWGAEDAILSRLTISTRAWAAATGAGWLGRGFYNVIGRPGFRGGRAEDLSFRVATLCNFPTDFINVDPADRCQVVSASTGAEGDGVVLRLMVGNDPLGPFAAFGVLKGGVSSYGNDKRYRRLNRREVPVAPEAVGREGAAQQVPLVPAAERWPTGRRN